MSDLESVISGAVEDAGDVGGDSAADTSVSPDAGAEPAVPVTESVADVAAPAIVAVEDLFAKEHGLTPKRPDGKENRIPYGRVKLINESAIKKAREGWDTEFKPLREEHAAYKARIDQINSIDQIMANEPERFIEMLAAANPAYARFAAVLKEVARTDPGAAAEMVDAMPEPDFDLGEGKKTYSMDGLERRMAWERRQAVKEADTKWSERIKPIEDRFKNDVDREKVERINHQVSVSVKAQLDKARTWPGFEENAAAILEAIKADSTLSIHDGYMKVVMPTLAAERTKMRQDLIAELKKTPASTSTTAAPVAAADTPQSIEDIIRASIAASRR